MEKTDALLRPALRQDLPDFRPGDTVKVHVRVVEGGKERIQVFEGIVVGEHRPKQLDGTFTVRRIAHNVGVERTFPLHSPKIAKIEVKRTGQVRRAKLYYLRDRVGKATRLRERKGKGGELLVPGSANDTRGGRKKKKTETQA